MNNCRYLLFCICLGFIGAPSSQTPFEFKWIRQKLDHFNDTNLKTFKMRYMVKEDYFRPNGTIFLFIGGEGTILSPWTNVSKIIVTSSYIHDLAKEFKGYLVHSEHRYYGESKPTRSLEVTDLKYLTVPQALADVAHLIKFFKGNTTYFGSSKVFLAGGSYTGFLVLWFAKLYPKLIDLGWGSSTPVRFEISFKGYYKKVMEIIKQIGGKKCQTEIVNGFRNIPNLNNFNNCTNFENKQFLYERIANVFGSLTQFGNKTFVLKACNEILMNSFTTYLRSQLNKEFESCNDAQHELQDTRYFTDTTRLWFYQQCSELGNFQTSDFTTDDWFLGLCNTSFGMSGKDNINEKIQNTDKVFEDIDSNDSVRRVFLTQAEFDPWSATSARNHNRTYFLKEAFHCEDLQPKTLNDKPSIKKLKTDIYWEVKKLVENN